jgi:hypothetical protein
VLDITAAALHQVSAAHRAALQRRIREEEKRERARREEERKRERIRRGAWHDGRLDCVAGNGVMSELGIGDEVYADMDEQPPAGSQTARSGDDERPAADRERKEEDLNEPSEKPVDVDRADTDASRQRQRDREQERKQRSVEDVEAVNALPVVILKNFVMRAGANEEVLDVLATWAASLAENQIAHVVVVSDNRENSKRLAKGASLLRPLQARAMADD